MANAHEHGHPSLGYYDRVDYRRRIATVLKAVKDSVDRRLARSPIPSLSRFLTARGLRILAYHAVSDEAAFGQQLDYLLSEYRPVSLGTVEAALVRGKAVPPRAVLVTFDDGDRSILEIAAPLLYSRGIPSAVFLVGGLIGTDLPAWWQEVELHIAAGGRTQLASGTAAEVIHHLKTVDNGARLAAIEELRFSSSALNPKRPQLQADELVQLESMGVAIGNHSWSHPCLDRCTDDLINEEVRRADESLRDILGHDITAFAYPNGNNDARVRSAVRGAGYKLGLAFDHRLTRTRPTDLMQVSRLRVDASASIDRFHLIVSGLHPMLHHALGRD